MEFVAVACFSPTDGESMAQAADFARDWRGDGLRVELRDLNGDSVLCPTHAVGCSAARRTEHQPSLL